MREKLLDLMKYEGLKPRQLAELLDINPAGISHILAGRNKPGFDLLQKILRRFPRINPDWLLLDSEKMYREENSASASSQFIADGLFGIQQTDEKNQNIKPDSRSEVHSTEAVKNMNLEIESMFTDQSRITDVERIVILYRDKTFDSFTPKK